MKKVDALFSYIWSGQFYEPFPYPHNFEHGINFEYYHICRFPRYYVNTTWKSLDFLTTRIIDSSFYMATLRLCLETYYFSLESLLSQYACITCRLVCTFKKFTMEKANIGFTPTWNKEH